MTKPKLVKNFDNLRFDFNQLTDLFVERNKKTLH